MNPNLHTTKFIRDFNKLIDNPPTFQTIYPNIPAEIIKKLPIAFGPPTFYHYYFQAGWLFHYQNHFFVALDIKIFHNCYCFHDQEPPPQSYQFINWLQQEIQTL